jgi:hypothetical protein
MGKTGDNLKALTSGCSWMVKSKCKPFTIGMNDSDSKLIGKTAAAAFKVQYVELRDENVASDKIKSDFVFKKGENSVKVPLTRSIPFEVTQYYSSAQATTGFKRNLPIDLIALLLA